MQNRGEFGPFGSFPDGRSSSEHLFWFLRLSLRWGRFVLYIQRSTRENKYTDYSEKFQQSLLSCRVFAGFPEDRRRKPTESPQTHWYLCSGQWTVTGKRIQDLLLPQWNSCKCEVRQRFPGGKQLLVCSLRDSPHPSRVHVHINSALW